MKKAVLPIQPRAAAQKMLKSLPNRRLRDVIERRYGLASGKADTLEAIGKSYGITRERVRQIEEDALKRLRNPAVLSGAETLFASLAKHLEEHGGVSEEKKLLNSIVGSANPAHAVFLMNLAPAFNLKREDASHHNRWYTASEALKAAETILEKTVAGLEERGKSVSGVELFAMLRGNARAVLGQNPAQDALESYLGMSKLIKQNPYGEFGLVDWNTITPSGVRDKAHVALTKAGEPLHFREVARHIDRAGWGRKKSHPQTVHNELIKDGRFVLVGRGLYALKEWGYEAGTVADVIHSIIKESRRPVAAPEIVRKALDKRRVKENTILLNLQNKKRFKRSDEGYTLV